MFINHFSRRHVPPRPVHRPPRPQPSFFTFSSPTQIQSLWSLSSSHPTSPSVTPSLQSLAQPQPPSTIPPFTDSLTISSTSVLMLAAKLFRDWGRREGVGKGTHQGEPNSRDASARARSPLCVWRCLIACVCVCVCSWRDEEKMRELHCACVRNFFPVWTIACESGWNRVHILEHTLSCADARWPCVWFSP